MSPLVLSRSRPAQRACFRRGLPYPVTKRAEIVPKLAGNIARNLPQLEIPSSSVGDRTRFLDLQQWRLTNSRPQRGRKTVGQCVRRALTHHRPDAICRGRHRHGHSRQDLLHNHIRLQAPRRRHNRHVGIPYYPTDDSHNASDAPLPSDQSSNSRRSSPANMVKIASSSTIWRTRAERSARCDTTSPCRLRDGWP